MAGLQSALASDITTVDQRLTAQLLTGTPSSSTVQGYMNSLQSNGSWSDINYSNTAQTNWTPLQHLDRLLSMAEAYSNSASSLYHNTTLQTDISNAFNYWITANPMSTNWYDNDIAAPDAMGSIMVLVGAQLSSTQLTNGNTILNRARSTLSNPNYAVGSNLVLLAEAGIDQGLVNNSSTDVSLGFSEIGSTVTVVAPKSGDGIQTDGTYNFHGSQLYEGDYGRTALTNPLEYASFSAGTSYALSSAQEQILVDALLNGTQWFVYGNALDFTASGRDPSRTSFAGSGTSYVNAIQYALSLGTYRQSELQAFLNRQDAAISAGDAVSADGLTGNRDFFDSDIMVQQRPTYYASAKVTSTRTINPESINGENLLGLYMADGVNQIMVSGNEYSNIEPVWNWRRLPGTTVEQNSASLQPGSADHGSGTFAGGVSDGTYGAEALAYNRFNVAANKSWFFFDNEEVALGSAINAPNATSHVDTTLNQCLLTSTVTYQTTPSGSPTTLTTGTVTPTGLEWVYQGGVGYLFLSPVSNATIEAQSQSGNWQQINSQYSNATVSENVFTLFLDHGAAVSNGSYSYIVVPNTTASAMATYAASVPIQILSNTANVQAVYQSSLDIAQAAFFNPASLSLTTGTLTVNGDSMVMLHRQPNTFALYAGSPQNLQKALNVQLAGVPFSKSGASWLDAFGNSTTTFSLPGGNYAGSSVGLNIATNGTASPTVTLGVSDINSAANASVASTVTASVTLPGNTIFQTDALTALTFSGTVSGPYSLTLAGQGSVTLSGSNSYSGGTTINAGTLVAANAAGSATGSGNVTLNGGTLASAITGGSITGNVVGGTGSYTLAPGGVGTVGDLSIGGLTTTLLATLDFDLGPGPASGHEVTNGDLLTLGSGTISIGPGTNLSIDAAPIAGDDYRLIGGNISSINLNDFVLPSAPTGLQYGLSKTVDPGYIDLTVTAVPEPGSLCVIGISMAVLLPRRRSTTVIDE